MHGDFGRGGGERGGLWERTYLHFQVMVTKNSFTARRKKKQEKALDKNRPIYR